MAIGITARGATANDKSSNTVSSASFTPTVGNWLIAIVAGDTAIVGIGPATGNFTVTFAKNVEADNAGNVVTQIWSGKVTAVIGASVVRANNGNADAKTLSVYEISGLDDTPFDKSASDTGSSTTPSSGATDTLSQADEIAIGAVGVEDEVDDMSGTWVTGAGNVSGNEQGTGTNGGGDASNVYIESAAEIVAATTAQTAAMTGIDSTNWGACVATYKGAAAPGGWTGEFCGVSVAEFDGVTPAEIDGV